MGIKGKIIGKEHIVPLELTEDVFVPETNFERLFTEILKGIKGINKGIPMGFNRLNRYVGIRKSIYYLIGGQPGTGKTSLVMDAFILNPADWYIANKNSTHIELKIFFWSMERGKTYMLAKWVARKIFLDTGIEISVGKLLGWSETLSDDELSLYKKYETYMDNLEKVVDIYEGAENPIGISKVIDEYFLKLGTVNKINKYKKVYVPNNPNLITLFIVDHIGLVKTTKDFPSKKEAIDKTSSILQNARDFYGMSPVVVSQLNRSISNPMRIKAGNVEPALEDFKDSGSTQEDADIVIAMFDPLRYNIDDPSGYDAVALRDKHGAKFYRSLRLIKNSYGEDDIRIGLAFYGAIGLFKELPKQKDMTSDVYESVINKSFFLS